MVKHPSTTASFFAITRILHGKAAQWAEMKTNGWEVPVGRAELAADRGLLSDDRDPSGDEAGHRQMKITSTY